MSEQFPLLRALLHLSAEDDVTHVKENPEWPANAAELEVMAGKLQRNGFDDRSAYPEAMPDAFISPEYAPASEFEYFAMMSEDSELIARQHDIFPLVEWLGACFDGSAQEHVYSLDYSSHEDHVAEAHRILDEVGHA